jgi:signal transduction histidine kinase/ActR/RegA family two-component response regulator
VGQCALEKEKIVINSAPPDYIRITSGLGEAAPHNIIVIPVLFEGQVKAVMELASFDKFSPMHLTFLDQLTESIGIVVNTIEANSRTEDLLKQSQSLARELQSQQQELQLTNQQLGEKAQLLAHQNVEVERKNKEVEQARSALEEKAAQLALTSRYKSEFLANMSHELRTPLNSLLILSDQLGRNTENNLSGKEVEFARTIHSAGHDLLALINDILDLSKIESGTVVVDPAEMSFSDLRDYIERTFRHVAESAGLDFEAQFNESLPPAMYTDARRLQQVIKNLLSNAFKFTKSGSVVFRAWRATTGWNLENDSLNHAEQVVAFSVEDTGIGVPSDKHQIIFEAFQQADGSTNRNYGGTGLGLAISREIARLLGGEIRLVSAPGEGSTFTLFLPVAYVPRLSRRPGMWGPEGLSPVNGAHEGRIAEGAPLASGSAARSGERSSNGSRAETAILAGEESPLFASDFRARFAAPGESDFDHPEVDPALAGKRVLVVDDDIRNVFAMTSLLEEMGLRVTSAENGQAALDLLQEDPDIDLVLMDIMLPGMDGYETIEAIRAMSGFRPLPIIAVTAKAMPGDREKCLEAGASDYLSKPVNPSQLLVLLSKWVAP